MKHFLSSRTSASMIENLHSDYLHTGQLKYFFNNTSGQLPIDTTIRVYGFGDTKNNIRWNYSSENRIIGSQGEIVLTF